MDLITVVLDLRQVRVVLPNDFNWFRERLLPGEHDGVLDGDVQVATANLGRMRACGLEQVADDVVDLRNFLANVLNHLTGRTGGRKVARGNLDNAGNPGQRITNFVGKAGGEFAERRQMFGAGHLRAVQAIDFLAVFAKLRHHAIKIAAQISDFVLALGEANADFQVAVSEFRDLLLEFNERTLNGVGEDENQRGADGNGARACNHQHHVTLGILPGHGGEGEQHHAVNKYKDDRQYGFDLPVQTEAAAVLRRFVSAASLSHDLPGWEIR